MKIIVLSDTHIPQNAPVLPEKVLEALKNADMAIHAGDFADLSVLNKIKSICPNTKAVCGNMDPYEIQKELPQKEIIQVEKYKIGIMHGVGAPSNLVELLTNAFKNDSVDIIIFGHSHSPMNERRNNILFFNPGSATDTIFAPYQSYGMVEINGGINAQIIRI